MYQAKKGSTLSIQVVSEALAFTCRGRIVTDTPNGMQQEFVGHAELMDGIDRTLNDDCFTVAYEVKIDFHGNTTERAQVKAELDPKGKPATPFCREVSGQNGTGTKVTTVGAMI